MMADAGFERVTYHNMTGGIVALHRGIKPDAAHCPAGRRRRGINASCVWTPRLPRLARLSGRIIEIDCRPGVAAVHPCRRRRPAPGRPLGRGRLPPRAPPAACCAWPQSAQDRVLHGPDVDIDGDSAR